MTEDSGLTGEAPPPAGEAPLDSSRFRQVLGHFCTGVTVLTALEGDGPVGFTAQSFTSVSLDPPMIVVCPAATSNTWPRIRTGGAFCANILAEDQEALGRTFATRGADRFAGVGWRQSAVTGSPVLDGVLAWVDCLVHREFDAGDHLLVLARVVDLGLGDPASPLLFYRAGYGRFSS